MTKKEKERLESEKEYYKNCTTEELIRMNGNFIRTYNEKIKKIDQKYNNIDEVINKINYNNLNNEIEYRTEFLREISIKNIISLTDNMTRLNNFILELEKEYNNIDFIYNMLEQ